MYIKFEKPCYKPPTVLTAVPALRDKSAEVLGSQKSILLFHQTNRALPTVLCSDTQSPERVLLAKPPSPPALSTFLAFPSPPPTHVLEAFPAASSEPWGL